MRGHCERLDALVAPISIGERLKTLDIDDACRYLGYWGTWNGDMSVTREVVRDLINSHSLTPEHSAELFAQKGIGAFLCSSALIEWSQSDCVSQRPRSGRRPTR